MATRLLKQHCYCPMLLMWTTKTAVCLQTNAIFHQRAKRAVSRVISHRHVPRLLLKVNQQAAQLSNESKYSKLKKTAETQLVRLNGECDEVSSEKHAYKSFKTALLLSNVIDVDHQNSCLFTNKCHFSSPLYVLIGILAKFHE